MTAAEAIKALEALKKSKSWVCNGYGTIHGYRKGRLWFACQMCRWYTKPAK